MSRWSSSPRAPVSRARSTTSLPGTTVSPGAADYWAIENSNVFTHMTWAKFRLWAIGGPQIFQPDVVGGTPDTGAVPIEPIFTNPQDSWQYTCIAEGPSSVYFGGHDGNQSAIQSITLDASGGLPTLTGATTAAVLPKGELISQAEGWRREQRYLPRKRIWIFNTLFIGLCKGVGLFHQGGADLFVWIIKVADRDF